MNVKQAKTIETVTTKQWLEWKFSTYIGGDLSVRITPVGEKIVVVISNVGAWPSTFITVSMVIGVKGGISKLKLHK